MPRKRVLITGASGGIGLELAWLFAAKQYDLVLVARSAPKLDQIAAEMRTKFDVAAQVCTQDLSLPGSAQDVFAHVGSCDVLVNNAGFGTYGKFAELDLEEERRELQLNIVTLTELTKLFLPGMIARKWGRVLNVASTAAFQPGPLMAVYFASKAYVLSFSEAIASEVQGTGVSVTCLAPGATQTGVCRRWRRFGRERGLRRADARGGPRCAGFQKPGAHTFDPPHPTFPADQNDPSGDRAPRVILHRRMN